MAVFRILAVVWSLGVWTALGTPALGQEAPAEGAENVIMVLDGSGSMWGQIDGTAKIQIARDVIGGLVEDWDPGVELGLIAYGHREEGNCDDIETLVPVGPVDSAAFMTKVNGINPVGKTPITAAVRKAAEDLRYTDEKATVILVSDGLETCNADPCALASELEQGGVNFTTHVVGFDVSQEESEQLACLAENTGGKFLRASTASELTTALAETVETVAQAEPEPEPAGPQGLKLEAVLCEGCEVVDNNLFWWIYADEQDIEGNREEVERSGDMSPLIEMPAGQYYVTGRYGDAFASVEAEVNPDELTVVTLNLNAGNLRVNAIPTAGDDPLDDNMFYWVYEAQKDLEGNRKEVSRSGSAADIFRLTAGDYHLVARHGDAFAEIDVTVIAGELTDTMIDMNVGYLRVNAIPTAGSDPLEDAMFYWVYEAQKDLEGNRKEISRSGSATDLFRLSAGDYHVEARHGDAFANADVSVTAGSLTEQTLDMNVGYLRADAVMAEGAAPIDSDMFYWVYEAATDLEGNRKEIARSGSVSDLFRLPAGDYRLVSRHGVAIAEADVSVTAGSLTEQTMVQNSAFLKVSAARREGEAALASDVFWWVYEAEQDLEGNRKEVTRSGSAEPLLTLPAGDYVLAVRNAGQVTNVDVTLTAGESKILTVLTEE